MQKSPASQGFFVLPKPKPMRRFTLLKRVNGNYVKRLRMNDKRAIFFMSGLFSL